jgi:hypothetical protein
MAKTFSQMKTNVGSFVQDTSTMFATLIGVWINDKYRDIARRCVWSALIDDNYTIPITSSAAEYDLPSDFDREVFVANITDGEILQRYNEGGWWRLRGSSYSGASLPQGGNPRRYVILRESSKIKFDPKPTSNKTIALPYQKSVTDLSGNTDTAVIKDIEYMLELGATAEALAYKKQYQKADYFFQRYESEVAKRIGQEKSQFNQLHQRISQTYQLPGVTRLTGDTSYDTV